MNVIKKSSLVMSLVPREFRKDQAPNFKELSDIIYSWQGTEYCPESLISERSLDTKTRLIDYFGRIPDVAIVYEINNVIPSLEAAGVPVILITEDLHFRSMEALRVHVNTASLILSRFNIIEDLIGESYGNKIKSFPLHCSNIFLSEPNVYSKEEIINFGNMDVSPRNIDTSKSPNANQYEYRKMWHNLLTKECGDRYLYIRQPPSVLQRTMNRYSFGFASTYFPYEFSEKCAEEQGKKWKKLNFPQNFSQSYFVAKFFEIAGSGLLLVADTTGIESFLEENGFIDMVNFVGVTPKTIQEKISYLFDIRNRSHVIEMRNSGHALVKTRHTIEARKAEYHSILDEFLHQT